MKPPGAERADHVDPPDHAEAVTDVKTIKRFAGRSDEEYQTSYTVDLRTPR